MKDCQLLIGVKREEEVTSDAWDCGIVYRTDRRCFDVKRRNDGDSFCSSVSQVDAHVAYSTQQMKSSTSLLRFTGMPSQ